MTTQAAPQSTRWAEITTIWKDNRWLYVIAGLLLGILVTPAIEQITGNLNDLVGNLVPEAIGIVFTVLILDNLAANRSKEELKNNLILQLGSQDNSATKAAIRALWANESLQNGDVRGANLWGANLEKADLGRCDLRDVNLWHANLEKAWLWAADLRGAYLGSANLRGAVIDSARSGRVKFDESTILPDGTHWKAGESIERFTNPEHPNFWYGYYSVGENLSEQNLYGNNLSGASIININMRKVNLIDANLENVGMRDVDLTDACLRDANLTNVRYVEITLPDGIPWTLDTDMSRYTNPEHPDFWQPEYLKRDFIENEDAGIMRPAWVTDDMLTD